MGDRQDRPFESTVILRMSGEITTKSDGIRHRFNRRLTQNLRDALEREGIEGIVRDQWYRVDVVTEDRRALEVGKRIFGIQGLLFCRAYNWETVDDIVEIGAELFSEKVNQKTFAVRTRRVGFRQQIPISGSAVDRALGARLVAAGGIVNLSDHQVRVGVEVRRDQVLFYEEDHPGQGGLPGGVEGRALAMMSGGFDSAVAAWTMMRRGVDLDFLFFNLAGPPQRRAVQRVVKHLSSRWAYGYAPRMHIVDLRPLIVEMRQKVEGRLWQCLLKRLMLRAGEYLAQRKSLVALVTGESCGQVSSQTLENLAAISAPIRTGIFRPLVGMHKEEIIDRARQIDTYEVCAGNPEFCDLQGGPPAVDATAEELDEAEALLDLEFLRELVDLRRILKPLEMEIDEEIHIEAREIPHGFIAIDLRGEKDFQRWHLDGAVHMSMDRAMEQALLLPKEGRYLLYCEVGLKSAFLAEQMKSAGFDVASFSGGVPKLKKHLKRRS